ncbi:Protein of unknown function (DUF574) [Saccharomonospora marina XMU15]|uniref:S-adenosyl methyltransferase n=1 Tax=Saccharomonospora marina XMU15 TaxID=882083 RepID=H5WXC4_9PSEU|nr:SAM-dependent methyltransferase [Saccharomonospora marina]EHR49453.1 Protein of unknown function (DUF574) [Saccharomonospora marina XMU15]
MALPTGTPGQDRFAKSGFARINDYWLDGKHHTVDDQRLADDVAVVAPHIPYLVRSQRALLGRIVRYLCERGVRQFLDLGSGIPTMGHVHESAQSVDPASRVVYVDIDPKLGELGREILSGDDSTAYLTADIRDRAAVLESEEVRRLLDLDQPVGVLMIETLLHFADSERPADIVAGYVDAIAAGSYVALSHCSENEQLLNAYAMFERMMLGARPEVNLRSTEELASYFRGLEIVEPGIVAIPLWRPDSEEDLDRNPEEVQMHVGVGYKRG